MYTQYNFNYGVDLIYTMNNILGFAEIWFWLNNIYTKCNIYISIITITLD